MFVKKDVLCLLYFPICFCPGRSRAQYIVLTRHIRQESPISPCLNSHDPVWHGQVGDETDSGLWNLCCYEAWMLLFRYALCLCPANEMGRAIQPAGSPTLEIGDPSRTSICLRKPLVNPKSADALEAHGEFLTFSFERGSGSNLIMTFRACRFL